MKKLLFLPIIAILLTMVSCNSDENTDTHPLKGTKWISAFDSDRSVILHFITEHDYDCWLVNQNNAIIGNIHSGTYSIVDNNISFSEGVDFAANLRGFEFIDGTLRSGSMVLNYRYMVSFVWEWVYGRSRTFVKIQ